MVGLRHPKKRTTKKEERQPQPLVTPAQRILQQQWLQPAAPQRPPRVRLPQGTEIIPVPVAAKRPKIENRANGDQGSGVVVLENIRISTVVPALLSPLSSDHDGEEPHVEEATEGEARDKMADPTPAEQAETITAHASSTGDAQPVEEASTTLTIVADVHAPAEPTEPIERIEPAHEQGTETRQNVAMAAIGDVIEEPLSLSQEFERHMEKTINLKTRLCERIAESRRNLVLIAQERETIMARVRELDRLSAEEEQRIERDVNRLSRGKDIFNE